MFGIAFEAPSRSTTAAPTRADVVCFIGYTRRRDKPIPADVRQWIGEWGWEMKDDSLENIPVPIERFETFAALFELNRDAKGPLTWMAAAVRMFFAQGGSRCFVVRVGDAGPLETLLNTTTDTIVPSRGDRSQWTGVRVLHGLEEANYLCLPDLPALVADKNVPKLDSTVVAPEIFVECSGDHEPTSEPAAAVEPMPTCADKGYETWFKAVRAVKDFLASERPDMQFIAAVPQPQPQAEHSKSVNKRLAEAEDFESDHLQLAWPWLRTSVSDRLPGHAEPPDAALAGIIARVAVTVGAHRSVGRHEVRDVLAFEPVVVGDDLNLVAEDSLIKRVSVLGPSPSGPRVLSDQTTARQPANVRRITASLIRASRRLGQSVAFEPSGPELWRDVRSQLESLMRDFYQAGALRGASSEVAFSVRCDESTITLNDRDNGRLIALVSFAPAAPVTYITVRLSLRDSGPTAS